MEVSIPDNVQIWLESDKNKPYGHSVRICLYHAVKVIAADSEHKFSFRLTPTDEFVTCKWCHDPH